MKSYLLIEQENGMISNLESYSSAAEARDAFEKCCKQHLVAPYGPKTLTSDCLGLAIGPTYSVQVFVREGYQ